MPKKFYQINDKNYSKYKDYNFFAHEFNKIIVIRKLKKCKNDLYKLGLIDEKIKDEFKEYINLINLPSLKEQIESYVDIGSLEAAFVKNGREGLRGSMHRWGIRAPNSVAVDPNVSGKFRIHTHPPMKREIVPYNHIPSVWDLMGDYEIIKKIQNLFL